MAMNARDFMGRFKQIKVYLEAHADASAGLKGAFEELNQNFKKVYSADQFKALIAGNDAIDNDLEERITSALILLNEDRTRRG